MKRFLIVLAALVLPAAAYFRFVDRPLKAKHERMAAEIRDLDMRIEQARAAQRKLPQFREEFQRLGEESQKLEAILPTKADIDAIHIRVEEDCAVSGVHLIGFEAGRPVPSRTDPYDAIFIDAAVTGGAQETAVLLHLLATHDPILSVSRASMNKTNTGWTTYFVIATYVMRPSAASLR